MKLSELRSTAERKRSHPELLSGTITCLLPLELEMLALEYEDLKAKAEKAELYEKALELCAKEIQPVVVFGHKPIYGYNTAEHWLEKAREGMNRE